MTTLEATQIITTSLAGGSLRWRGCNGNVVISPEAASVLRSIGLMG